MSDWFEELGLADCMPFGKYQDKQIEDLICDDPLYLQWCVNEEVVKFDEEVTKQLEEMKVI